MQATLTMTGKLRTRRNLRLLFLEYSSLISPAALVLTISGAELEIGKLMTIGHNDAIAAATSYFAN